MTDGYDYDTVFLNYYAGDGISNMTKWATVTTPYTSFPAGTSAFGGGNPYAIDIAALINSNLGSMSFIGFRWTIDPFPHQAFISMDQAPVVNYTVPNTVPEPTTMLLLGLGLIGVAGVRRRMS